MTADVSRVIDLKSEALARIGLAVSGGASLDELDDWLPLDSDEPVVVAARAVFAEEASNQHLPRVVRDAATCAALDRLARSAARPTGTESTTKYVGTTTITRVVGNAEFRTELGTEVFVGHDFPASGWFASGRLQRVGR